MSKWQEHRDWADSFDDIDPTIGGDDACFNDVCNAVTRVVRVLADIGEELEKANTPAMFSGFPNADWGPMSSNPLPEHAPGCNQKPVTTDGKCACGARRVL